MLPAAAPRSAAASAVEVAPAAAPAAVIFEPQAPDANVLLAQGLVLLLTGAAAAYWWLVVVPSERAALGRSKRRGALDAYLQELEAPGATQGRRLERWFYTDWLQQRERRRTRQHQQQQQREWTVGAGTQTGPSTGSERAPPSAPEGGAASSSDPDPYDSNAPYDENLLRPSAETPTPRFLSLDNPIVATAVLLLLAGLVAGLQRS